MKDWPAFLDLKKKIDDFSETCPLLELMANKVRKTKHSLFIYLYNIYIYFFFRP